MAMNVMAHCLMAARLTVKAAAGRDKSRSQCGLRDIGEQQAEAKPRDQRERRGQKCLPEENGAECAAVHAEHAVKAEFLLAATQEKAVRVEEKQRDEHRYDERAEAHRHRDRRGAGAVHLAIDRIERGGDGEVRNDVQHRCHERAGEKIGHIEPCILFDTHPRKAGVKGGLHAHSPPVCCCVSASVIRW